MRPPFALLPAAAIAVCAPGCSSPSEDVPVSGDIVTLVGDGTQGHDGDGVPLRESSVNNPMEVVFDSEGTLYIVDWNNHSLRRVTEDETLETVMGTELPGDWPCQNPDDPDACEVPLDATMPGADLSLNHPMDLAFAGDGTAYVVAWHNHKLERFSPAEGTVQIVAGRQIPGFEGDGGAATEALMNFPDSIVIDGAGALLVSDQRNNRVRRIDSDGIITTIAGAERLSDYGGDDGPATECLLGLSPYDEAGGTDNPPPGGGLALDPAGNLYIADTFNHCVRRVDAGPDGQAGAGDLLLEIIETVAGQCGESGFSGDGARATEALLHRPHDVEIGPDGHLYIADTENHAVRRVDLDAGVIETIAGTGVAGFSGDVGPATGAKLRSPYGIAFAPDGALLVVDTKNNRIRRILP